MFRLTLFALATCGVAGFADDPPKTDFKNQMAEIAKRLRNEDGVARRLMTPDQARRYNGELRLLVESAEKADKSTISVEDQAAVAQACLSTQQPAKAAAWARAALAKDEKHTGAATLLVQALLSAGDPTAAEAVLLKHTGIPSATTANLKLSLATIFESKKNYAKAIEHLSGYVNDRELPAKISAATAPTYTNLLKRLWMLHVKAGKPDVALAEADRVLGVFAKAAEKTPGLSDAIGKLRLCKAEVLFVAGKPSAARHIVAEELAAAKTAIGAGGDKATAAVSNLVEAANLEADNAADDATAEKTRRDVLAVLSSAAEKADDAAATPILAGIHQAAAGWVYTEPKAAEAAVNFVEKMTAAISERSPNVKSAQTLARNATALKRQLEPALNRQAMIGKKATPIDCEAWVNGSPISPADLQGKVVLLDFWAVWCGPCIATFPHLREWNEKYADKGLTIVGLTKYYGYDFDKTAGRPVSKGKGGDGKNLLSPEAERAACELFAKHHQLTHRLGYSPENSKLSKEYGVTGIPQAVLIDRSGNIRMIRVGSGEANAKALERMIKILLDEPAKSAGG